MALTASLVERTPNKLRYLVTSDGAATASPDTVVIPNAAGVTPDLRTDADAVDGSAIDNLVSETPIANQAAARRLLNGDLLDTVTELSEERGHLFVTPRNALGDEHWGVDANEGAAAGSAPSAGFAVIVVTGPNTADAAAYVELLHDHTLVR